eukprot:SAG11_NODE_31787_length_289_cov_0.794737_1_plen_42_part_01
MLQCPTACHVRTMHVESGTSISAPSLKGLVKVSSEALYRRPT